MTENENLTDEQKAKAAYEQADKEAAEKAAKEQADKEAAEKKAQEQAAKEAEKADKNAKVECMYCGKEVKADKAITDKTGKTFCKQEHADIYAKTMQQINHTY
jgi:colicin import membrane protein